METVLVQLTSIKAMKLLKNMEELPLLRVLKKADQPETLLSEKYAGKLPANIADGLQHHIEQSRSEWNSDI